MKKIVSLILCAILMVSLIACGGAPAETTPSVTVTDGQVVGEGAKSFPLTIVDKEGNAITITVNTDKEMVGEALTELGIVEGTMGEYGLYMTHVNVIPDIWEDDGYYWSFYINDEYAMTGVDQTPSPRAKATSWPPSTSNLKILQTPPL